MTRATGRVRPKRLAAGLLALAVVAGSSGCLFHRKKAKASAPAYPPSPVRIALLPPNIPSDDAEMRWVSLATVALLAKEAKSAQDLELVPVWQALPVAIEALGGSRTLTDEIAAYVASRVGASVRTSELEDQKLGSPTLDQKLAIQLIQNANASDPKTSTYDAGEWGALALLHKFRDAQKLDPTTWLVSWPLKPADGSGAIRLKLKFERQFPELENWPPR